MTAEQLQAKIAEIKDQCSKRGMTLVSENAHEPNAAYQAVYLLRFTLPGDRRACIAIMADGTYAARPL